MKFNTKAVKATLKASAAVPAAAPFCIDAAAKAAKRRKKRITINDIAIAQVRAVGGGRWNFLV